MGPRSSACSGQDRPHEGRRWTILAAGNPGQQPAAGAGQRDRESIARCYAGESGTLTYGCRFRSKSGPGIFNADCSLSFRHASHMMSKSARDEHSLTVFTTPSSSSRTRRIPSMALHSVSGLAPTRNEQRQSASCDGRRKRTITIQRTRHTGFHTASVFFRGILCTIFWVTTFGACGSIGTKPRISSTLKRYPESSVSLLHD